MNTLNKIEYVNYSEIMKKELISSNQYKKKQIILLMIIGLLIVYLLSYKIITLTNLYGISYDSIYFNRILLMSLLFLYTLKILYGLYFDVFKKIEKSETNEILMREYKKNKKTKNKFKIIYKFITKSIKHQFNENIPKDIIEKINLVEVKKQGLEYFTELKNEDGKYLCYSDGKFYFSNDDKNFIVKLVNGYENYIYGFIIMYIIFGLLLFLAIFYFLFS